MKRTSAVLVLGILGTFLYMATRSEAAFDPWVYVGPDGVIDLSGFLRAENDLKYGKITQEEFDIVYDLYKSGEYMPGYVPPPPPVFDPWNYDFDFDGFINWSETERARYDWETRQVITEEEFNLVYNLWFNKTRRE